MENIRIKREFLCKRGTVIESEQVKLSIIVPVFNCERTIKRCLLSIQNQSLKNFEVILIDDGSSDGSGKILEEFSASDCRFKVIYQDNHGVAFTRNLALRIAVGEYVGWIDADDHIPQNYFNVLVNCLDNHNVDISMCDVVVERNDEFRYDYPILEDSRLLSPKEALSLLVKDDNCKSWLMNKCFRRSLFNGIKFPLIRALEDYAVLHKVFWLANGCYYTRDTVYFYEENSKSLTHSYTLSDKWAWVLCALERYYFINQNVPDLKRQAMLAVIKFVEDCFSLSLSQGLDVSFWREQDRRVILRKYFRELSEGVSFQRKLRWLFFSSDLLPLFPILVKIKRLAKAFLQR